MRQPVLEMHQKNEAFKSIEDLRDARGCDRTLDQNSRGYAVCRRVGPAGQRALNGHTVRAVDQLPLDAFATITSSKNRTEVGSEHWD